MHLNLQDSAVSSLAVCFMLLLLLLLLLLLFLPPILLLLKVTEIMEDMK